MSKSQGPAHVVVDGSNIATEGRSMPSLTQLNDAVTSFMDENPDTAVTVVVDATFGHRIDKSEVKEFEEGIANNELVAPPAGAVGRGDAFVLGIADKANATVLSNDSFQEFHGEYDWLFDEGRLIGGKPVPHVGWVWVARVPVRGPVSRKATRSSRSGSSRSGSSGSGRSRRASKAASAPMPVPTEPPPATAASGAAKAERRDDTSSRRRAPRSSDPVNELLPFLEFVEHHPIGTSVNGTVDTYSSHGAYVTIGEQGVRGYVPLRLMGDPAPRSARTVMKIGEAVTVVVVSFAPARRSIDCALPDMAEVGFREAAEAAEAAERAVAGGDAPPRKKAAKKSAAKPAPADVEDSTSGTEPTSDETADATPVKKTAARKRAAKKSAAKKTSAKKTSAKKTAAKKTAAKKTSTAKKTAAKNRAPKKSAAKKTAAKKRAAKKSAAKKPAAGVEGEG